MNGLTVPNHIGVILDGNRRWAKAHNMPVWMGHRHGADTLEKFLDWCLELNIPHISVYTLSTENINRPKRELKELLKIYYEYLVKLMEKKGGLLDKYEVNVRFIGNLNRLPKKLVRVMGRLMEKTANHQKKFINFLVAYGAHSELTNVVKKIAEKVLKLGRVEVTQRDIEKNLLVPIPLDLVIRTGGMSRLSNFLMWQASYAELYITKTLWPDFTKKELIKAIKWYNSVKRNFGG